MSNSQLSTGKPLFDSDQKLLGVQLLPPGSVFKFHTLYRLNIYKQKIEVASKSEKVVAILQMSEGMNQLPIFLMTNKN